MVENNRGGKLGIISCDICFEAVSVSFSESARLIKDGKDGKTENTCCEKNALLGEAKQRGGNREHSIANRNLFLSPPAFLFLPVLVLNFEKGACAIYCNLSRPEHTHIHTHE